MAAIDPASPTPVGPPPPIRVHGVACTMGPPLTVRLQRVLVERDRAAYQALLRERRERRGDRC